MRGAPGGGVGGAALTFCARSAPPPPPPGGGRARRERGSVRGRPPRVLLTPLPPGSPRPGVRRAGRCGPRGAGGAPGLRGGGVRSLRGAFSEETVASAGSEGGRRDCEGPVIAEGTPCSLRVKWDGRVWASGEGRPPCGRTFGPSRSLAIVCSPAGCRRALQPRPGPASFGSAPPPPSGLRSPQVGGGGSAVQTHVNRANRAGGGGGGRPSAGMTSSALDAKGRGSPGCHVTSLGPGFGQEPGRSPALNRRFSLKFWGAV